MARVDRGCAVSWRRRPGEGLADLFRLSISVCWLLSTLMVSIFVVWFTFHGLRLLALQIARHVFGF